MVFAGILSVASAYVVIKVYLVFGVGVALVRFLFAAWASTLFRCALQTEPSIVTEYGLRLGCLGCEHGCVGFGYDSGTDSGIIRVDSCIGGLGGLFGYSCTPYIYRGVPEYPNQIHPLRGQKGTLS